MSERADLIRQAQAKSWAATEEADGLDPQSWRAQALRQSARDYLLAVVFLLAFKDDDDKAALDAAGVGHD